MSLRFKVALIGSLLLAMSLGVLMYFTLGTLRDYFESQQQSRVNQLSPLLNAALAVPLLQRDYASVQAILTECLEDPALVQIAVYEAAGRLVASARRDALDGAFGDAASDFRADLALAGQTLGLVTFTLSRADLDLAQAELTRYLVAVGGLALAFSCAVLWFLSGTVTRRLQQLAQASRSIRQGHYALQLPAASNDEVGLLVRAFSTMSDEIQHKVEQLQALNDVLEQQVEQRTHDLTQRTVELDRSLRALQTKTYLLNRAPFAMLMLEVHPNGPDKTDTHTHTENTQPEFTLLDATDALADLFGHQPQAVIGQSIAWLEPAGAEGVLLRQLRTAAQLERAQEWEAGVRCGAGGVRWTRCLAVPLRERPEDGLRLALCLVDIQELWQAREDQRRVAGDLQESNKLQSLGLAIAGIAHDLNTPIGIALTAATLLRSRVAPLLSLPVGGVPPVDDGVVVPVERLRQLHTASEMVASNLAKAGDLVKGLKTTTANASRVEWRKLWLLPFFEALLATLSPITHRARCTVRLTCPSDLALFTEPGSLGQVVSNLVVNATLHAFEGRTERELRIEVSRQDQQVLVRVADNGCGMSAEASARAFSPFFTTRRASGGSGLGLFSARRVTQEVLGGDIELQSTSAQGTAFLISLPWLERPPAGRHAG